MIKKLAILLTCACGLITISSAYAFCPSRVAYLEQNGFSKLAFPIMAKIYQDLGCSSTFVELPGRRSVTLFNNGEIDAELFRSDHVELKYKGPFLRSEHPIFHLRSYLFTNPTSGNAQKALYGYVKGIMWHEQRFTGSKYVAFLNTDSLFKAYNAGKISGFISNRIIIEHKLQKNELIPPPILIKEMQNVPLYHYTQKGFKKFIFLFDQYITTHHPFANFIKDNQSSDSHQKNSIIALKEISG